MHKNKDKKHKIRIEPNQGKTADAILNYKGGKGQPEKIKTQPPGRETVFLY